MSSATSTGETTHPIILINVGDVVAALLSDGWHDVDEVSEGVSTFAIDAYEFVMGRSNTEPTVLMGGGVESEAGVPARGFVFESDGDRFFGPITGSMQ